MTMSIRRMSLGEGYRYLLSSVARGDGAPFAAWGLARYYAESGTRLAGSSAQASRVWQAASASPTELP